MPKNYDSKQWPIRLKFKRSYSGLEKAYFVGIPRRPRKCPYPRLDTNELLRSPEIESNEIGFEAGLGVSDPECTPLV